MAGHHPWSNLRDAMTPEQNERVEAKVRELRAEMVLAELRRHSDLTQAELARKLGVSQPVVSEQEGRTEMEIGTLSRWIEACGGSLELIAHLPGGDVRITQFAGPGTDRPAPTAPAAD